MSKTKKYDVEVNIVKGEGLKAADTDGKSDPLVKVKAHGTTFQTKAIKHNLNPEWNEKFDLKKKYHLVNQFYSKFMMRILYVMISWVQQLIH